MFCMNLSINCNFKKPAEPTEPTFFNVATDYIQKPIGFQRMVILPVVRLFGWAKYFYGTLSQTASVAQKTFRHTNHFLFWLQYPEAVENFCSTLVKLKSSFQAGSLSEVCNQSVRTYRDGIFTIDIFADLAKILHKEKIITLSSKALHIVNYIGFLGNTALAVAGAIGVIERIRDLRQWPSESPHFKWNLIRLINRICVLAIGIFGIVNFAGLLAVPTPFMLTALTVLLITALWAHFYEKLVVAKSEEKVVKLDYGKQGFHGDDESALKTASP